MKLLVSKPFSDSEISEASMKEITVVYRPFITTTVNDLSDSDIRFFHDNVFSAWVVTSKNASLFIGKLLDSGLIPYPQKIFAVGKKTVAPLTNFAIEMVVPTVANAQNLAQLLIDEYGHENLCLFCGNMTLGTLPHMLGQSNISFSSFQCYNTIKNKIVIPISDYDALAFFSPSAVEAFVEAGNFVAGKPIFALGNTTAMAVHKLLHCTCFVPELPTIQSLINTVNIYNHETNK